MINKKITITGHFLAIFLIFVLIFAVFWQVRNFTFLDYDDTAFITKNPFINSGISKENISWAFFFKNDAQKLLPHEGIVNLWLPLSFLSHMLDVHFWGLEAPGKHHLVNFALHSFSGILLYFFCFILLKSWQNRAFYAFFIAVGFSIHPLHVESVAWLSARKDVLSGVFFHLSLIFYLNYINYKKYSFLFYVCSFFAFILAVLSKSSTLVLPFLLILLDFFFFKPFIAKQNQVDKEREEKSQRNEGRQLINFPKLNGVGFNLRKIFDKLPFLLVSFVIGLMGIYFQYKGSHSYFTKVHSIFNGIKECPALILSYLERFVLPINLFVDYPRFPYNNFFIYSSLGCVVIYFCFQFAKENFRKFSLVSFGFIWFLICLFPTLGFAYVGSSFGSDRYTYLGLSGLLFVVYSLLNEFIKNTKFINFFITLLLCIWAFLSYRQCAHWENTYKLFSHGIKAQKRSHLAWQNLGTYFQREAENEQKPKKKRDFYQKAYKYQLKSLNLVPNHISYYNLATISEKIGDETQKIISLLEKSLKIYPYFHIAHYKLGIIYFQGEKPDYQLAKVHLEKACKLSFYKNRKYIKKLIDLYQFTRDYQAIKELEKMGIIKLQ